MPDLTVRETEALGFIRAFHARHDVPPTLAEIAQGLGLKSRANAHRYAVSLEAKGLVERRTLRGATAYYPIPEADA